VLDAQWLQSSGEPTGQDLSPGLAPKKRPLAVTVQVKSCTVGRGSLYRPLLDPTVEFLSILGLNPGRFFPKGRVFLLDTAKKKCQSKQRKLAHEERLRHAQKQLN
jgi:hypothetical protein